MAIIDLDRNGLWTAGLVGKKLSRSSIGTRFFRSVNLRISRDWVFCEMGRNGSCGITWTHIFFHLLFYLKKTKNSVRGKRFLWLFPRKHKEFRRWWFELRWWWFEIRRWRLQLQRWRFELWWCFDLVFFFLITHNYELLYYNVRFFV